MAAERTFLAWLRTGISLMGFGFVVACFGLFLRELVASNPSLPQRPAGFSLPVGILLILIGMLVNIVAGVRQARYIQAINRGDFRAAFGSRFRHAAGHAVCHDDTACRPQIVRSSQKRQQNMRCLILIGSSQISTLGAPVSDGLRRISRARSSPDDVRVGTGMMIARLSHGGLNACKLRPTTL